MKRILKIKYSDSGSYYLRETLAHLTYRNIFVSINLDKKTALQEVGFRTSNYLFYLLSADFHLIFHLALSLVTLLQYIQIHSFAHFHKHFLHMKAPSVQNFAVMQNKNKSSLLSCIISPQESKHSEHDSQVCIFHFIQQFPNCSKLQKNFFVLRKLTCISDILCTFWSL